MVILVRLVQFQKHPPPNEVTELGMVILVSLVQFQYL